MNIWQPIVNCGLNGGDIPFIWHTLYPSSLEKEEVGFKTEEECQNWINKNQINFTIEERNGGVVPMMFFSKNPILIDENGYIVDDDILSLTKEECLESLIFFLNTPIMRRKMSKDLNKCLDKYLNS